MSLCDSRGNFFSRLRDFATQCRKIPSLILSRWEIGHSHIGKENLLIKLLKENSSPFSPWHIKRSLFRLDIGKGLFRCPRGHRKRPFPMSTQFYCIFEFFMLKAIYMYPWHGTELTRTGLKLSFNNNLTMTDVCLNAFILSSPLRVQAKFCGSALP